MATTSADPLDCLYPRLLSSCSDQSIDLLHHRPKTWLENHNTDIAAIIAGYSDVVPLLRGLGSVEAVQKCLFPRTWILGASFSTAEEAEEADIRRLRDCQADLGSVHLLGAYRDVKEQLRQLFLPEHGAASSHCAGRQPLAPHMLDNVMQVDALHLAALVLAIIADNGEREKLISKHPGDKELDQNLLDLLYALLGIDELEVCHDTLLRALVELSKNTGLFPQHLVHSRVRITQQWPFAEGSFGSVYKGDLDGQPVAVKLLKRSVGDIPVQDIVRGYSREAILWSQLHHTNVLPFYGVYFWESDGDCRVGLLSPWMVNGNLSAYLRQNRDAAKLSLIIDIAQGLRYLHTRKPAFIHGDLKPNNVLVTPSGTACLADFGLGRLAPNERWSSTSVPGGPLAFSAPELVLEPGNGDPSRGKKTTESDVYAFACLCYEIYSPRRVEPSNDSPFPWHANTAPQITSRVKPASMEDELWEWLSRMWDVDPKKRPTIHEFLEEFRGIPFPPRGQHSWDSTATARLRSISLVASDPRVNVGNRPGLAYESSLHAILSSSTLATAESGQPVPGPPTSGSSLRSHPPTYSSGQQHFLNPPSYPPPSVNPSSPLPLYDSHDQSVQRLEQIQPRLIKDVERITFSGDDIIIALMGPSGTGKSTFINCALKKEAALIGHGVKVCTEKVQIYGCDHPLRPTRRVFFVDTPGMEDSERSDRKTLKMIAKWLKKTYKANITLTGILQFHRITDARMGGANRANLEVFQEICGKDALKNVIVVSTGWEEDIATTNGPNREQELLSTFLSKAMEDGCQYSRFLKRDMTHTWAVVDQLPDEGRPLQIQREMLRWRWDQTSAFKALRRRFAVLLN